jgi:predicted DCC family thiol-disulfide oxidoreductase YuxK
MGIAIGDNKELEPSRCTLIYDAGCRFCVASKEGIERLSPPDQSASVRYIPYQSAEAEHVLGPGYQPGRPEVAYLVDAHGQIRKGLDAIVPLLWRLPGGRFLMILLAIPGCRSIASWLYRIVARHRYRWFGALPAKLA